MAYYSNEELKELGFLYIGKNVKVSKQAAIYNHEQISIGDNSRIDDFCIVSGKVDIGRNIHITPQCLIAGGEKGIILEDYVTLAYGVKVFSQSDDYSGETMTNSLIPKKYKNEYMKEVIIKKHSIVGASSVIMPGVVLEEGTSIGSMSLVTKSTKSWGIYVGIPVKRLKDRSKNLLKLMNDYEKDMEI